ncbi:MAG: metal ABC transporter permease, partial [Rhodobacterales bacterium]|nr:metal ABC transporter permease [Rhodobacterales bacterium]
MIDDFVWRAALAGIGIALAAGPLGCFIVWRRMAYFGDSLAHGALLGVALGLAFGIAPTVGVLVVCAGATLLLVVLESQRHLATDTLLGMLAHSALSFGLIAIGLLETVRVDLVSYLFGDVLSVTVPDLYWIYGGSAVVLAVLAVLWRPLLALTVDAELARA